jgi:hypothetical protein
LQDGARAARWSAPAWLTDPRQRELQREEGFDHESCHL